MKKFTYILMLCVAALSCSKPERIFSEGASERIADAVDLYKSAILARGTWVMEYFPDDQLRYGGWVYVLDFREDNSIEAWFEGSGFVPSADPVTVSEYAVEFSTGPMLKFCTNNDYLHYFSFPGGPNGGGYQGYRGDYEFTIMSLNETMDEIILRGIKTENRIRLSPLSGKWTPEEYINAVRDSELSVRRTSFDLTLDGVKIGVLSRACTPVMDDFSSFSSSKIWTLECGEQKQDICTITLPDGIMKAYAPFTVKTPQDEELSLQTFRWVLGETSGKDEFVCIENGRIELK